MNIRLTAGNSNSTLHAWTLVIHHQMEKLLDSLYRINYHAGGGMLYARARMVKIHLTQTSQVAGCPYHGGRVVGGGRY